MVGGGEYFLPSSCALGKDAGQQSGLRSSFLEHELSRLLLEDRRGRRTGGGGGPSKLEAPREQAGGAGLVVGPRPGKAGSLCRSQVRGQLNLVWAVPSQPMGAWLGPSPLGSQPLVCRKGLRPCDWPGRGAACALSELAPASLGRPALCPRAGATRQRQGPGRSAPCWGRVWSRAGRWAHLSSAWFFPTSLPKSARSQLMQSPRLTLRGVAEAHVSLRWASGCQDPL